VGILGHLDRGGRFLVQQQEAGDNFWESIKHDVTIHWQDTAI